MKPFNWYSRLYAPEGEGGGGDGKGPDDKVKGNGKLKVGGTEYEEADLNSAISLYKALQDEDTGKEIITRLATKAGLLNPEGTVKRKEGETKKEAESRAVKILKSKLGKDYEKFADAIGPAFDEIIEDALKDIKGRLDQPAPVITQREWNKEVETFMENYDLDSDLETAMMEAINDTPPKIHSENFDPKKYLRRRYMEACEELGVEPKNKTKQNKRGSSRRDNDDEFPDVQDREAPKGVTLDDAIEAAMRGIRYVRR